MKQTSSSHSAESTSCDGGNCSSHRLGRLLQGGCYAVAFLVPIKLSLTYIALIPLLVLLLALHLRQKTPPLLSSRTASVVAPLVFFLICVSISALTGVSPGRSVPSVLSLLFFSATLSLFYGHASPPAVLSALVAGQTIAAIHSTLDAIFPETIPHLFVGKVTESGQLAVTLPLLAGMIVSQYQQLLSSSRVLPHQAQTLKTALWSAACISLLALTTLSFRDSFGAPSWMICTLISALVITWSGTLFFATRICSHLKGTLTLCVVCAPLLVNALLVNLKRGPWLGVIVAILIFCSIFAKRLILVLLMGTIAASIFISPVRERIADSYDHFTISGGRSTIWRIGAELASEYPLGIGYHNSGILRQFAPEIPPELKHFHNNILNITAESGWLAGLLFIWFIFSAARFCIRQNAAPIVIAIGCAVLSWQTAGLVEYNFGDSEVTLLIWIALGVALQTVAASQSVTESQQEKSGA